MDNKIDLKEEEIVSNAKEIVLLKKQIAELKEDIKFHKGVRDQLNCMADLQEIKMRKEGYING